MFGVGLCHGAYNMIGGVGILLWVLEIKPGALCLASGPLPARPSHEPGSHLTKNYSDVSEVWAPWAHQVSGFSDSVIQKTAGLARWLSA